MKQLRDKRTPIERVATIVATLLLVCMAFPRNALASDGSLRIHVLTISNYQDAIVLECDGRFGMVDSGEDDDYPSGEDARYPYRPGTTMGQGHQDEVIAYLTELGVTPDNFEFYIGTHPHSDHIGSADEVIRAFKPMRVYSPAYEDEYIRNASHLWDNLYVYDHMREAAEEVGASFITDLSYDSPVEPDENGVASPAFSLGSSWVEIVNWENHELYAGAYEDANDYCWGVLVSCGGRRAFLAGDINNSNGDEDYLAGQLGAVDVLKLGHHGNYRSNAVGYLQQLQPSYAVVTGPFSNITGNTVSTLLSLCTHIYSAPESANEGKDAIVFTLSEDGVWADAFANPDEMTIRVNCGPYDAVAFVDGAPVSYSGVWTSDEGKSYLFDGSPYGTLTDSSNAGLGRWIHDARGWWWKNSDGSYPTSTWKTINGTRYHFNRSGYMDTGWIKDGGSWYYLDASGALAVGWRHVKGVWYYFDSSALGAMAVGWKQVGDTWYLFNASGAMLTGWQKNSGLWYYLKPTGAMATGWIKLGGKWYLLDRDTGAMLSGWQKVDGTWYWLDSSGIMATGWRMIGSRWYWFNASGAMHTGWKQINGSWYWFDASGAMLSDAWTPDGYYMNKAGVWVKGKTR